MTDYSKLKVPELKDELKARGEPLTGLKLKQQFIDRLLELDARSQNEPVPATQDVPAENGGPSPPVQDQKAEQADATPTPPAVVTDTAMPDSVAENDILKSEQPSALPETQASPKQLPSVMPSAEEPQPDIAMEDKPEPVVETQHTISEETDTPMVSTSAERELSEDNKKRKRRSITPVPASQEISLKKAKALNGSPRPTKVAETVAVEEDLEKKLETTRRSTSPEAPINGQSEVVNPGSGMEDKAIMESLPEKAAEISSEGRTEKMDTEVVAKEDIQTSSETISKPTTNAQYKDIVSKETRRSPSVQPADEQDRQTSPALHPATSSIYIRNLKRPLQVGVLRRHLEKLASPPGSSPQSDIVSEIFLDSIKSHAFVSFSSISAASRARFGLHDVRWPEEPMRDALWVDFIPDEKVKDWIEIENSSLGGNRGIGKRWEVVYETSDDGDVQATLQEAGTRPPPTSIRKGSLQTSRDLAGARPGLDTGVHPDRAGLVSESGSQRKQSFNTHRDHPPVPSRRPPPISGKGFRALDDLFPSTVAKPKLYYKPVSDELAESRKDAFRDLFRVPRIEPGEEMKRYSFEDGDKWVDKGPEFGYGASRGRGGGIGFRGRGSRAGAGSSWRRDSHR